MQKFIITATTDALIKADARFTDASQTRGPNAVNVVLKYPDGMTVGVECFRDPRNDTIVYKTSDESLMDDVTGDFNALGVENTLTTFEECRGLRVNVLEILKAGILVHAPANRNALILTLPSGYLNNAIELAFRNDGTNLWADTSVPDLTDAGWDEGVLEILEKCFVENRVAYEVL